MTKLPEKLPCDVTIGVATFRRGVPTRLVLEKIQWWQDMVDKGETPPVNGRPQRQQPEVLIDDMCRAYYGTGGTKTFDTQDEPFKDEMRGGMREVLSVVRAATKPAVPQPYNSDALAKAFDTAPHIWVTIRSNGQPQIGTIEYGENERYFSETTVNAIICTAATKPAVPQEVVDALKWSKKRIDYLQSMLGGRHVQEIDKIDEALRLIRGAE